MWDQQEVLGDAAALCPGSHLPHAPVPQVYWWHEKYRPRRPKYFNRVHTGYEWNKYNQTHYDADNPPPKTVQVSCAGAHASGGGAGLAARAGAGVSIVGGGHAVGPGSRGSPMQHGRGAAEAAPLHGPMSACPHQRPLLRRKAAGLVWAPTAGDGPIAALGWWVGIVLLESGPTTDRHVNTTQKQAPAARIFNFPALPDPLPPLDFLAGLQIQYLLPRSHRQVQVAHVQGGEGPHVQGW